MKKSNSKSVKKLTLRYGMLCAQKKEFEKRIGKRLEILIRNLVPKLRKAVIKAIKSYNENSICKFIIGDFRINFATYRSDERPEITIFELFDKASKEPIAMESFSHNDPKTTQFVNEVEEFISQHLGFNENNNFHVFIDSYYFEELEK